MFASAQTDLHRATLSISAAAGLPGEDCRIDRQRATGSLLEVCGISIGAARSGVVEADNSK